MVITLVLRSKIVEILVYKVKIRPNFDRKLRISEFTAQKIIEISKKFNNSTINTVEIESSSNIHPITPERRKSRLTQ